MVQNLESPRLSGRVVGTEDERLFAVYHFGSSLILMGSELVKKSRDMDQKRV